VAPDEEEAAPGAKYATSNRNNGPYTAHYIPCHFNVSTESEYEN
jgi:hypothetical protein